MTLMVLAIIGAVLFGLAYATKRRFGVLGLALAAGLVLSGQAAAGTAAFLQNVDIPVEPLTYQSAATVFLLLAPALLLLSSGPRYAETKLAVAGSVAFALVGVVLLVAPLGPYLLAADHTMQPLLSTIVINSPTIVSVAILVAVIDMMNAHAKKPFGKKDKH